MRYDYVSYIIAILCFMLGALLFLGYAQYIELTTGSDVTDLVITEFSAILGLVFVGLGYAIRPKIPTPAPLPAPTPSTPPKPTELKPRKESEKRKRAQLKRKLDLTNIVSLTLFGTGVAALTASILYSSSTIAFIGLGLTFWGAIFLYIRTEKHIEEALLDKTTFPSLVTLNKMIAELGFKGQAVYLPPKYLKDFESSKLFIAKQEKTKLPTPKQIQKEEERIFVTNPEGILLTPPGADLTKLFEKTLDTSFTRVDLQYLERNLPRLLVEDLEIAENLEIEAKKNKICLKIENTIYKSIHAEAGKLPNIGGSMGCPICSAIACAIAKAAGKPVIIERDQTSEDGQTITIEYSLL